jgi:hypothetical protein
VAESKQHFNKCKPISKKKNPMFFLNER